MTPPTLAAESTTAARTAAPAAPQVHQGRGPGWVRWWIAREAKRAVSYETGPRPWVTLIAAILILHLPGWFCGFILDDHRAMRLMTEFRQGNRDSLDLFRFLDSGQASEERRAGRYPWWLADGVRYRHWRPLSEWTLYGQFTLFGAHPWGYRLVSLALYAAGVLLVLQIYRSIQTDEAVARWGAMVFAVAAGHAIPVAFVSAQSDLWALIAAAGAMLLAARYRAHGGAWRLAAAAACYAAGLGAKEAVLPCAVLPFVLAWGAATRSTGQLRRGLIAAGLLCVIGGVYLALYIRGGFGADTALMLDPVRAPGEYLAALPGRAILLLSTWVMTLTPFFFYFDAAWRPVLYVYGAVGATVVFLLARWLWRQARGVAGVKTMALWPLPFIPVLACTVPDDRVMMLPGIGLAFLAGVWIRRTSARPGPAPGARNLPTIVDARGWPRLVFVHAHAFAVVVAGLCLLVIDVKSSRLHRAAAAGFGREIRPGDCAFYLGPEGVSEVLFAQDCAHAATGGSDPRVAFLSDVRTPHVQLLDAHTLRLSADGPGLLAGFLGRMARTRGRAPRVGDEFDAGEFVGRITSMEDGRVAAVELRFSRPMDAEQYRFYRLDWWGRPMPWRPDVGG